MDRRSVVFLAIAGACFALYPLADEHDHSTTWQWGKDGWAWVPVVLGVTYLILALLSWLDHRSRAALDPRPLGYDKTTGEITNDNW